MKFGISVHEKYTFLIFLDISKSPSFIQENTSCGSKTNISYYQILSS